MNLDTILAVLAEHPDAPIDLAQTALLLARDEYTDLDVEGYLSELDAMAHELQPRLHGPLSDRLAMLSRYLFHEMGFRGNEENYYDPLNSYFNQVMDRRVGLPITLSILAIAIGKRAGLQIEGVGLPGHFIAKATMDSSELFFDAFHGGRVLTFGECEDLVRDVTGIEFEANSQTMVSTPSGAIVLRMLTNLKAVYLQTGDFARGSRIVARLCLLVPDDATQRRDLGICLLNNNQPGRAIPHLERYLEEGSPADAEKVKPFLIRAQDDVAKWN